MARLITGGMRITSNKSFGLNTEYVDNDVDVDDVDDDVDGKFALRVTHMLLQRASREHLCDPFLMFHCPFVLFGPGMDACCMPK